MTAQDIRAALNDEAAFNAYFKFTIIRNPWDRLVSALAWTDQKWVRGEELAAAGFDDQVRQLHAHFMSATSGGAAQVALPDFLYPQYLYIFGADQKPLVNFIARYENLQQDWRTIREKLRVDVELPCRMKSHHRSYREYYTEETRKLVGEMYALDVGLFRYEF
jgi:hypothetical protein